MSFWESSYEGTPPWDIEGAQPALTEIVRNKELKKGSVLDIGCGLGDNSIFLVKEGYASTCMDIAHLAIEKGRKRAAEQNARVEFRVGDVLKLDSQFEEESFDNIFDSGLFHTLSDDVRPMYVKQIHRVLTEGGKYFMLCFSDKEPPGWGPRRISKEEIEETFRSQFKINYMRDTIFANRIKESGAKAYITSMTKRILD